MLDINYVIKTWHNKAFTPGGFIAKVIELIFYKRAVGRMTADTRKPPAAKPITLNQFSK